MEDPTDKLLTFLSKFHYDPDLPQYKNKLLNNKELKHILTLGNQFFYIIDLSLPKIIYISANVEEILGFKKEQVDITLLYNSIHPEDADIILKATKKCITFGMQFPKTKPFEYIFYMDYRMKRADGQYIRVMRQTCKYSDDHQGNMALTLGIITDITHLNKGNVIHFAIKGTDPNILTFPDEELLNYSKLPFTHAETAIMKLLAKGLCSKEIAHLLKISKLTVDKHRRNMLQKSNLSNVAELMVYAREHGVI
jgi:DNA-binding CsgD family transcriptional regulator